MKCPDLLVLSSYYDKELDDATSRNVKAHLVECSSCKQIVENFGSLSLRLNDDHMPAYSDIRPSINKQIRKNRFISGRSSIWNRRLQIPAPLAAAAAIALFAGAFGLQVFLPGSQSSDATDIPVLENSLMLSDKKTPAINNGDQMAVIMPVDNLDQLFEMMEKIDQERFGKVEEVILPAEFDFSLQGESGFYKTADYQGGKAGE